MKIIDQIGVLAISSRLQRLSDTLRKDGALIYKEHGINFEPKWFPVVFVLNQKSPISIVDLANELGFAHPSVIQLVKELEKEKIVKSFSHKKDGRKRLLELTPKASKVIEQMKPVWTNMTAALESMPEIKNVMKTIDKIEFQLQKESIYNRVKKRMRYIPKVS